MALEDLMRGHNIPSIGLKSLNVMESPVPCSSNVWVAPGDKVNTIKKVKKSGKRPASPIKLVWEFLQYETLNRLFHEYKEAGLKVNVPTPLGVDPPEFSLYTEYASGFILFDFDRVPQGTTVKHYTGERVPIEYSVAFHLGVINQIKEWNSIYHSDYDLRHIIFDPETGIASMFDLENTRYAAQKPYVQKESERMISLWIEKASKRGADKVELQKWYQAGRDYVRKIKKSYCDILAEVADKFGIKIRSTVGEIDGNPIGLTPLKIHNR